MMKTSSSLILIVVHIFKKKNLYLLCRHVSISISASKIKLNFVIYNTPACPQSRLSNKEADIDTEIHTEQKKMKRKLL